MFTDTALRKIDRARRFLDVPFPKISDAFQRAGGACKSVLERAVKKMSGGSPSTGLLRNREGKARRTKRLEVKSKQHTDRDTTGDNSAATQVQGQALETSSRNASAIDETELPAFVNDSDRLSPIMEWVSRDQAEQHPQAELQDADTQPQQSRRGTDEEAVSSNGRGKRRRQYLTRTNAAHVDFDDFVENLAEETGRKREDIDYVINRMSVNRTSDSTKSITSFIAQQPHGSDIAPEHCPLCSQLLAGNFKDRETAAAQLYQEIQASGGDNHVTRDGKTPLHLAVNLGYDAVCGMLLWAGADPEMKTQAGYNVWEHAKSALKKCAESEGTTELSSHIEKCRDLVAHGLEGVPREGRYYSQTLLDLCNQLDGNAGRQAERQDQFEKRRNSLRHAVANQHRFGSQQSFDGASTAFQFQRDPLAQARPYTGASQNDGLQFSQYTDTPNAWESMPSGQAVDFFATYNHPTMAQAGAAAQQTGQQGYLPTPSTVAGISPPGTSPGPSNQSVGHKVDQRVNRSSQDAARVLQQQVASASAADGSRTAGDSLNASAIEDRAQVPTTLRGMRLPDEFFSWPFADQLAFWKVKEMEGQEIAEIARSEQDKLSFVSE